MAVLLQRTQGRPRCREGTLALLETQADLALTARVFEKHGTSNSYRKQPRSSETTREKPTDGARWDAFAGGRFRTAAGCVGPSRGRGLCPSDGVRLRRV